MIQLEETNVYRLSAHAEQQRVSDEVAYLGRLVNARTLLMDQRRDMRLEVERCEQSISHLSEAIILLDRILKQEAQFNEPDKEA